MSADGWSSERNWKNEIVRGIEKRRSKFSPSSSRAAIRSKHPLNNSTGTRYDLYLHIPRPSLLSLPPSLICLPPSPSHRVDSYLDFYRIPSVTWRGGRGRWRFWYTWWLHWRTDDQFLTRGFSFNIRSSREKANRGTFFARFAESDIDARTESVLRSVRVPWI